MNSRDTILQRLRNRSGGELRAPECDFSVLQRPPSSVAERVGQFQKTIESVHAEVHRCTPESWVAQLAEILSSRGGIAETGSVILWPTADEPRLMSLVPPIHIAVLNASELYKTFYEAMRTQSWASGMPTNALLISGPSKTADIEQTLAYGVHGPKELIILVIE